MTEEWLKKASLRETGGGSFLFQIQHAESGGAGDLEKR